MFHCFSFYAAILNLFELLILLLRKNFGLNTTINDGIITIAPIKQDMIESTTSKPKNLIGANADNNSTLNPITTDNALYVIPRPVVVMVVFMAFVTLNPFFISFL